jgi:hypothetical protein
VVQTLPSKDSAWAVDVEMAVLFWGQRRGKDAVVPLEMLSVLG